MRTRGLKTHSLGLPFLFLRMLAPPVTCGLRVTPGWETLAGRSLCSGNGPWGPAPWEGSHPPRQHPGNLHTAVPLHLLFRRELLSLGLSAPCSAPVGRIPWAPTWSLGLGAPIGIFHPGSPTVGWPSISLQRPPVPFCFLLPELALLPAPALGTPGLAHHPLPGTHGRCQVAQPGDPSMAPGPLRCTPTASFPMGRTTLT